MTPREFAYWMKGMMDKTNRIEEADGLTIHDILAINTAIDIVFTDIAREEHNDDV